MPELPEVEVVRRGLADWVIGRQITGVEATGSRSVRRHEEGPVDFVDRLRGTRVESVCRRGKYLWLPLDSGEALVAHLGMSGQLLLEPEGAPDEKHLHVRFTFADGGRELRFVDQRTFGGLHVQPLLSHDDGRDLLPAAVTHIARDPLDPDFDLEGFVRTARRKRTGVKRALLDQTLVSGIGNIYADEALWRARLHYDRSVAALPAARLRELIDHVVAVMEAALAQGGTSFDALYVDVNGASGYFDRSLDAYGQEGEPCARCGALIVREPFMNRSSFRCPRCQRSPRRLVE